VPASGWQGSACCRQETWKTSGGETGLGTASANQGATPGTLGPGGACVAEPNPDANQSPPWIEAHPLAVGDA
jgi:hypothetical protein